MQIRIGVLTAPHIDFTPTPRGFILHGVRIGIGFHWDRREDQEFVGQLDIIHNANGTETAVNTLDLEEYITSVISSEMASSSPTELLKAHAIISRSWAVRTLQRRAAYFRQHPEEINKEGEFHRDYELCADDHCQRYQGIGRVNERAREAVEQTRGMVLTYDGEICDCRYHKCCGGRTEVFSTCWEDKEVKYLQSVECPYCEEATREPMRSRLLHSLNGFDQETTDFHHWQVRYSEQELGQIFHRKTGIDIGTITAIEPLEWGKSGRIKSLKIVGEKGEQVIGKELVIRQALSHSTLYSSWFTAKKNGDGWTLDGYGWGHGVGLCQIGAAVMAEKGFTFRQILSHYYCHAVISMM